LTGESRANAFKLNSANRLPLLPIGVNGGGHPLVTDYILAVADPLLGDEDKRQVVHLGIKERRGLGTAILG
jgi:hypothetical protein